jgi:ABC-type bacteriocin/lantibiotic exporter with double-glycine peptidase domain
MASLAIAAKRLGIGATPVQVKSFSSILELNPPTPMIVNLRSSHFGVLSIESTGECFLYEYPKERYSISRSELDNLADRRVLLIHDPSSGVDFVEGSQVEKWIVVLLMACGVVALFLKSGERKARSAAIA